MEGLEIRSISVANLPDIVSPCMLAGTLGSHVSLPAETADEMTRAKMGFFHERMRAGASAMGAYKGKRIVGLLEYYPIEVAPVPVIGNDLFVINCLQVPEREDRALVEKELVAACVKDWSSRKGVAVLGRQKRWDTLGFEEVTRDAWPEGGEMTLWLMKFWEVEEPKLAPLRCEFPTHRGRVRIDILETGRCPWDTYVGNMVRRAVEHASAPIFVETTDLSLRENVLKYGLTGGIAINGEFQPWLRPHPVPTFQQICARIEEYL